VSGVLDGVRKHPVTCIFNKFGEHQDFKVAFLNLELPDQDLQNAKKNIELIKAQLNMDFEPDADLSFRNAMNQQYEKLYYAGQYPTIPILNPFNWAKFLSQRA